MRRWRWSAIGSVGSSPAVAGGVVYVAAGSSLYAFSAAGAGCSGTPKTCTPLWTGTGTTGATYGSPAVAGGVVYRGRWYAPFFSAYES